MRGESVSSISADIVMVLEEIEPPRSLRALVSNVSL